MVELTQSYDAHRGALFGLCYRMTGSAAEAEDLVQETFRRALERPPADQEAPIRPWLMKVATNLCIDALRKRQRERYFGPWLPAPEDTSRLLEDLAPSPEARYGLLESASTAFLLALEALDPRQRAVLVLRDVLGLTGPETAEVLSLSPENVRVVLHRGRKALEAYESERNPPSEAVRAATTAALRRFMLALAMDDGPALLAMMAEDARSTHDGGGDFHAAVRVVRGREKVLELYRNLARITPPAEWVEERDYNGLPALAVAIPEHGDRYARRFVASIELDRAGKIAHVRCVLATRKLHSVRFR